MSAEATGGRGKAMKVAELRGWPTELGLGMLRRWSASPRIALVVAISSGLCACGEHEPSVPSTHDVEVRVVSQTGTAVPDAHLWVEPLAALTPAEARPAQATTGPDGRATLVGLSRGLDCVLFVSPMEGPPIVMDTIVPLAGDQIPLAFTRVRVSPWRPHDDVVRVRLKPK